MTNRDYECPTVHIHFIPSGFWFSTAAGDLDELFQDPRLRLRRVAAIEEYVEEDF